MLEKGLRYLLLWNSPTRLCCLEYRIYIKRAFKALACQAKHFLQFSMNSCLLFFPPVGFVYVLPLAQRRRPSPPACSSDPPWSHCLGELCFSLPDLRWEEAKGVVKVQLGVRVVDLCFRGFGIRKIFPNKRCEGNSSCQWAVLAPPVLVGYILFSETNWRIFQIPKILPAQQNEEGVWHYWPCEWLLHLATSYDYSVAQASSERRNRNVSPQGSTLVNLCCLGLCYPVCVLPGRKSLQVHSSVPQLNLEFAL